MGSPGTDHDTRSLCAVVFPNLAVRFDPTCIALTALLALVACNPAPTSTPGDPQAPAHSAVETPPPVTPASALHEGTQALLHLRWPLAIPVFIAGIESADPATPPALLADLQHNLSEAYRLGGRLPEAALHASRAIELRRRVGDTAGLHEANCLLATIRIQASQCDEALPLLLEALPFFEQLNDLTQVARIHNHLGVLYEKLDQWTAAILHLSRASRLASQPDIKDASLLPMARMNLGVVYHRQNQFPQALAHFERAQQIALAPHDPGLQIDILLNQASSLLALGNQSSARNLVGQALDLLDTFPDPAALMVARGSLGQILLQCGDLSRAHTQFSHILSFTRRNALAEEELTTLLSLAEVIRRRTALPESARDPTLLTRLHLERANHIARAAVLRAELDQRATNVHSASHASIISPADASLSAPVERRLARAIAVTNAIEVAECLLETAEQRPLPPDVDTLDTLREALQWARRAGTAASWLERRCHTALATEYEARSEWSAAVSAWSQAAETIRGRPHSPSTTPATLMQLDGILRRRVLALARDGHIEQAFHAADRLPSNALRPLRPHPIRRLHELLTPDERTQYDQLRREATEINRQRALASPSAGRLALLDSPFHTRRAEIATRLQALTDLASQRATELPPPARPPPPNAPDSTTVPHVLLRYLVFDTETLLLIRVTSGRGLPRFHVQHLPATSNQLTPLVHRQHASLELADPEDPSWRTAGKLLHQLLFEPVRHLLPHQSLLAIVPDGILWDLSFPTLIGPQDRLLLEDHPILLEPSAEFLDTHLSRPFPSITAPTDLASILVLANPSGLLGPAHPNPFLAAAGLRPIPGARQQAGFLQDFFGTSARLLSGDDATRNHFLQHLEGSSWIHITTHASFDPEDLDLAGIWVAPPDPQAPDPLPDLVALEDIHSRRLPARAVVLAACESARTTQRRLGPNGHGLAGLAAAFLTAGADSCLASQWKAIDATTARLMERFYRDYFSNAHPNTPARKVISLRNAQLSLRDSLPQDHPARHPGAWASFVWFGDPR